MVTYYKITKVGEKDWLLPNEPFEIFGQLVVSRLNNQWIYAEKLYKESETMLFPDENYSFEYIDKILNNY